jgi:hypothetical protein
MSGAFRIYQGVLCRLCPEHINIRTIMSLVSSFFAVGSPWAQIGSTLEAMSLLHTPSLCFVTTCGRSKRPDIRLNVYLAPPILCPFGLCSFDIGARNVAPFHMYHAMDAVNCRAHVVGARNTWAVCQSLARSYVCTYRILWERHMSRPYVSLA